MKQYSIYAFSFLLLVGSVFNDLTSQSCEEDFRAYELGERLEYKLYFNWTALWLKAGIVSFDIKEGDVEGQPSYHVVANARTPRSFDWFYKVRDRYETHIDYYSLNPLRFVRDINEGGFEKQLQYTFDPPTGSVNVDYHYRKGEMKAKDVQLSVPACTQDLLSSFYYARNIDYSNAEVGDTINVDLFMDQNLYSVYFRFLGRDVLETDDGTFNCIKFSPNLIEGGVFEEDDNIEVWVTDDENKIPVYIESQLNFGKIKGYLTKSKGLKYEQTALLGP